MIAIIMQGWRQLLKSGGGGGGGGGGLKSFHWPLTGNQSSLPIGHDARHKRPAAVNFSTGVVKGT